jgi:RNA polymerase sigma-70 factor (ECF subfamily)
VRLGTAGRSRSDPAAIDADARLMLDFAGGDDAAFDALFDRWSGPLLRFVERMVSDRATAEELVQDAFLRVHRARARYEPTARFSTWLYRIAGNLARNELRRPRRARPHASTDDASGPSLELVAGGAATDDLVDSRRMRENVAVLIEALPERQRMALWLSAVEGLRHAEIAEVLETTPASVKALIHRGRSALVAALPADGSGEE